VIAQVARCKKLINLFFMETEQAVNPNKALWEKGDFTQIASTMRISGARLASRLNIIEGMKVLDVGCGDGTTAIPMARLGADVLGVDIARNLVDAGNARVRNEAVLKCRFQEGDATNLEELEDESFDLVVSIFGVMFAPRPADVARELVRVTRTGGRIIMGNWIPGDPTFVAQVLKISAAYTPPPPEGFVSPMLWGVESHVTERFELAGISSKNISFKRETFTFITDNSPADFIELFREYYGPTMNAFEAAAKTGREQQLRDELIALCESQNQSGDKNTTSIPATFLLVTVNV
jgi:SAM-dependent methyltransferase